MENKPLAPLSSIDQSTRNRNATAQRVWATWALSGVRIRILSPNNMVRGPNVQRALLKRRAQRRMILDYFYSLEVDVLEEGGTEAPSVMHDVSGNMY